MKHLKALSLALTAIVLLAACGTTQTVPLTGRKHKISVSDEQVLSLSTQEYNSYMSTAKRSTNTTNTAMVERVGKRLASAVEEYLNNNGYASDVKNYSWSFALVQDNNVNAFCMPGGKIVVYEGLLPVTQNETCLAIVLGHEIAHAVAKHSAEQMTKKQNQQVGTNILGTVLNQTVGNNVGTIASNVAGQYFSFRNLKYSRDNESEADYMGLIFAAMAGYDPQQAIPFWQRMAATSTSTTSELLSSHPSDEKRIAALQQEMPKALEYYKTAVANGKAAVTTTTKTTTTTSTKTTSSSKKSSSSTKKTTSSSKKTTTTTKRR